MARYQDAIGLLRQQIVENTRVLKDRGPRILDQKEHDELSIEQKRLEASPDLPHICSLEWFRHGSSYNMDDLPAMQHLSP